VRRTIQIALLGVCVGLLPSMAQAQWYPYPYPYRYFAIDNLRSSVRVEVSPKNAEVFVDGYYAGIVDDFDGAFQRLRVTPGQHEIVVRHDGFRSLRENVYLTPDSTHHIKARLEPLAAGAPNEPPPTPMPPAGAVQAGDSGYPPNAPQMPRGPRRPPIRRMPPQEPPPQEPPPPPQQASGESSNFGALVIRVQPSDADILIDGERWRGPQGEERLVVQLPEGTHRLEIQKDGFQTYSGTIEIRRGETNPLNISLPHRDD
jgi:hypothetical protein